MIYMIYLLIATGLTSGGSSTVHITVVQERNRMWVEYSTRHLLYPSLARVGHSVLRNRQLTLHHGRSFWLVLGHCPVRSLAGTSVTQNATFPCFPQSLQSTPKTYNSATTASFTQHFQFISHRHIPHSTLHTYTTVRGSTGVLISPQPDQERNNLRLKCDGQRNGLIWLG